MVNKLGKQSDELRWTLRLPKCLRSEIIEQNP